MPIERRIRQGAERNAGVLDPDVDRFLDSVVHKTRRRQVVRRSLSAAACGGRGGAGRRFRTERAPRHRWTRRTDPCPGPSRRRRVTPVVPLVTGTFTRSIPEGTALVRVNGIAGTMDDQRRGGRACAAGCSRLVRGSACVSSVRDAGGYPSAPSRSAPTSARGSRPGDTPGRARGTSSSSRRSPTRATRASSSWARVHGPSPRNACSNGGSCLELGYAARFGHGTRPRAVLLRWLGRREREASAAQGDLRRDHQGPARRARVVGRRQDGPRSRVRDRRSGPRGAGSEAPRE